MHLNFHKLYKETFFTKTEVIKFKKQYKHLFSNIKRFNL